MSLLISASQSCQQPPPCTLDQLNDLHHLGTNPSQMQPTCASGPVSHQEPLGDTTSHHSVPAPLPRALAVSTRCLGPGLVISLIAHTRAA